MSRIADTFATLGKKKALIPYITAGDPSPNITLELMQAMVESGADIIELGVPFSDPAADGPVLQRAALRALKHNVDLNQVLDIVKQFRKNDNKTPVVLMGYTNPIHAMGYQNFAKKAQESGVDGVLTVDLPPEESSELISKLKAVGIDTIYLIAPTTQAKRIAYIAKQATGYLYYVSLKGVTGSVNLDIEQVARKIAALREQVNLPISVGFGINNVEMARKVAQFADAVVVGSSLVAELERSTEENAKLNLMRMIAELKAGIS